MGFGQVAGDQVGIGRCGGYIAQGQALAHQSWGLLGEAQQGVVVGLVGVAGAPW